MYQVLVPGTRYWYQVLYTVQCTGTFSSHHSHTVLYLLVLYVRVRVRDCATGMKNE